MAHADTPNSDRGDFAGAIDQIQIGPDGFVSGWVYQASRPGQVAEFRTNGGYVRLNTGEYRPDVKGGGPYGFSGWLGRYNLDGTARTLKIIVPTQGQLELVTKDYAVLNRAPTGRLDGVSNGVGNGWAFDPDNAAAPLAITVVVLCPSGQPGRFDAQASVPVTTGDDRPDVRAAYPQAGVGKGGFHFAVPNPERFRGRGCQVSARAADIQGNPEVFGDLSTADVRTQISLPFD